MEGILVLVRHGESEWNALNKWTGWTDVGLSEKGKEEAKHAATLVKDISFQKAFTSTLKRAQQTLELMLSELGLTAIPVVKDHALDERNYGVFTGKNKLEVKSQLGEEEFLKLRRGWDYPIAQGESLKDVYTRVVPYYEQTILPLVKNGEHVLVAAHGNSLRALMKYLEHIADADIANVELATGQVIVYHIDALGNVVNKEVRSQQSSHAI